MHLKFISLQAHNPVDDAKEELKKDISNLRQEVMVGFVLQSVSCNWMGLNYIVLYVYFTF